ncbi:MAG: DUF4402 domain-containing protein [Sphingomonadales bacterium]|jgi:hypothetical protein|nr:DUF4402 domain-containing protein [Sphingomonadales bacterium]
MKNLTIRALATAVALVGASGAAHAATGTGNSTSKVLAPITITPVDALNFGKFASDNSGNTIVDMDQSGAVTCMGASLCGANAPTTGSFDVSGTPNQVVHISSPSNFFLYNGANSVEIGNIVFSGSNVSILSYFHSNGQFDGSGALHFKVSGSLWMTSGTPAGDYSGNYSVVVNYQ